METRIVPLWYMVLLLSSLLSPSAASGNIERLAGNVVAGSTDLVSILRIAPVPETELVLKLDALLLK